MSTPIERRLARLESAMTSKKCPIREVRILSKPDDDEAPEVKARYMAELAEAEAADCFVINLVSLQPLETNVKEVMA